MRLNGSIRQMGSRLVNPLMNATRNFRIQNATSVLSSVKAV
jgi:hypothetical protein